MCGKTKQWQTVLLVILAVGLGAASAADPKSVQSPPGGQLNSTIPAPLLGPAPPFRGVFFNPKVTTGDPSYSWRSFYKRHRAQVRSTLRELVSETGVNLVDIFVSIPYSLRNPAETPPIDKPFNDWAELAYLGNVVAFVDDCSDAGESVELDLVSNMWIPCSVDPKHQIANSGYWHWSARSPRSRLSAFSNLRKWIVDDLDLPPDYWMMTSYPLCDPAPGGFSFFEEILSILGPGSASRLISTDLKGPGHDDVADCILSIQGRSGPDLLKWHYQKCASYGFVGCWIWAYQDTPTDHSGIRDLDGNWKTNLTRTMRSIADADGRNQAVVR
jgi:hypothetical protein